MNIVGYVIMGIGVFFMCMGVIGLFQRKKDFYYRIIIACKIDTIGLLTFCIGMAFRHGLDFFTGKMFLIVILILVLNPLVAHIVARAAFKSGYKSVYNEQGETDELLPEVEHDGQ